MSTCWICGGPADSAEHRIKRSDLVRFYGKGPYKGDRELLHATDEGFKPVQGPNSRRLKYEKSLCHPCNTTRTQPYDRAYDAFIDFIFDNEQYVLRRRMIDFGEVYGDSFEEGQRNLYKYLVKSYGCRLVDAGRSVPFHLRLLLQQDRFLTKLRITFAVNEDWLLLDESLHKIVGKGDMLSLKSQRSLLGRESLMWSENISWLWIYYWYDAEPNGPYGAVWTANSRYIYLGSVQPFPADVLQDVLDGKFDPPDRDT